MNIRVLKQAYFDGIGTFLLALIVSASGYVGFNLTDGNLGLALLINSVITGVGLFVLIILFRPISGAQFNPIVSLLLWIKGRQSIHQTMFLILFQTIGAILGVLFMHILYDLPIIQSSLTERSLLSLWISELFSSIVLLLIIMKTFELDDKETGILVGSTVMIGYWVTSSTFFANPALTIARSFTNTFVGIQFGDLSMFIICQLCAVLVISFIHKFSSLEKK